MKRASSALWRYFLSMRFYNESRMEEYQIWCWRSGKNSCEWLRLEEEIKRRISKQNHPGQIYQQLLNTKHKTSEHWTATKHWSFRRIKVQRILQCIHFTRLLLIDRLCKFYFSEFWHSSLKQGVTLAPITISIAENISTWKFSMMAVGSHLNFIISVWFDGADSGFHLLPINNSSG